MTTSKKSGKVNATKKPQKYIVRCHFAGVFFGEIKERKGTDCVMTNVRKIWSWEGACAVEELAVNGTTTPRNCQLTVTVDEMIVMDPVQIIPCTNKATAILEAIDEWKSGH